MNSVVLSVVLTLLIQSMVSMVVFTPPVLAPVAASALGLANSSAGLSTTFIYLGAALAAPISAGFIARLGPLRTSQGCLLLVALGISSMAIGHPALAALGAILIGFGYGPVTPSSSAILNERSPPHLRAFIFSLKQTGVPVGGMLAGALVPLLIHAGGWRGAAFAVAAASLVLLVLIQGARAGVDAGRDRSATLRGMKVQETLRMVWCHRDLRRMALASFAYSGIQMCLGSYLVVLLHDVGGFSLVAAGAALSVAMAGGVIGRIGWGVVCDRGVPPRVLLGALGIAMSLLAFTMPLVGTAWPWPAVLVLVFCFGATAVGWNGVHLSEIARLAGDKAAAVTGGTLAITYSGVVLMPLLIWTAVALGLGYGAGFVLVGLITLSRGLSFFRR